MARTAGIRRTLIAFGSATAAATCIALGAAAANLIQSRVVDHPPGRLIAASGHCEASCRAAYAVIGKALQHDETNTVSSAILGTPRFDYRQLERTLEIPSFADTRAQWRRRCDAWFGRGTRAARICYRLIREPPSRFTPSKMQQPMLVAAASTEGG